MTRRRRDWQLILTIGHKYLINPRGEIAVVDDSSDKFPEDSDDGVLLLDRNTPIFMNEGQWYIPLRGYRDAEPIYPSTPASWHEVVAVAHQFRMTVNAPYGNKEVPVVKSLDAIMPCSNCGELGADHESYEC